MICFYCGTKMTTRKKFGAKSPRYASVDHKIPTSRGKEHSERIPNNTVRCCQGCNRKKGNQTIEEFRILTMYRQGLLDKVLGEYARDYGMLVFPGEVKEPILE